MISFLVLPNLLMTNALAKRLHAPPEQTSRQKVAYERFQKVGTLNELLKVEDGEALVYAAILLYPDMFVQLIQKVAKQTLNSDLRKSYFTGYQCSKWADILQHEIFTGTEEENLQYEWICNEEDNDP